MMRRLSLLLALLFCQMTAWAHKASDSYLVVDVKGQAVTAQWDIALRDIDFALGLDHDGNAEITWGELRARQSDVAAWALSRLAITRSGTCPLKVTGLQSGVKYWFRVAALNTNGLGDWSQIVPKMVP